MNTIVTASVRAVRCFGYASLFLFVSVLVRGEILPNNKTLLLQREFTVGDVGNALIAGTLQAAAMTQSKKHEYEVAIFQRPNGTLGTSEPIRSPDNLGNTQRKPAILTKYFKLPAAVRVIGLSHSHDVGFSTWARINPGDETYAEYLRETQHFSENDVALLREFRGILMLHNPQGEIRFLHLDFLANCLLPNGRSLGKLIQ